MKKKNRILYYSLLVIGVLLILTNSCKKDKDDSDSTPLPIPGPNVTDIDGNIYHSVIIGTQTWTVENLKTTKYRDGSPIPNVTNDTIWNNLSSGAYCNNSNDTNYSNIYGKLYNWYAVNDSLKLAPNGWHIPSDAEWNILEKYLDNTVDTNNGGYLGTYIGCMLKEIGTTHWNSPNVANNSSGFSALPGGMRVSYGMLIPGSWGCWWTSTRDPDNTLRAFYRGLYHEYNSINKESGKKIYGFSVRCLKD